MANNLYLTDENARNKVCHVSMAYRWPATDSASTGDENPHNCKAADCMAWRWRWNFDDKNKTIVSDEGYCGLAGKP